MEEISVHKNPAGISGTALKRIACVSMLLDHIGASCLETGLLPGMAEGGKWAALASSVQAVSTLDFVLRLIGRIAFPIYCFLLVEGFLHTHDVKKYLLRLALFALLSEVPFDLAFFGQAVFPAYQNVYFTLLLGLLCIIWMQHIEKPGIPAKLLQIGALAVCGGAAALLRTDYDFFGVGLIAVLYLLRKSGVWRIICGCLLTVWEYTAPLAFLPIYFYNGKRGRCSRSEQYLFYLFYPLHLSLLACITLLVLR